MGATATVPSMSSTSAAPITHAWTAQSLVRPKMNRCTCSWAVNVPVGDAVTWTKLLPQSLDDGVSLGFAWQNARLLFGVKPDPSSRTTCPLTRFVLGVTESAVAAAAGGAHTAAVSHAATTSATATDRRAAVPMSSPDR